MKLDIFSHLADGIQSHLPHMGVHPSLHCFNGFIFLCPCFGRLRGSGSCIDRVSQNLDEEGELPVDNLNGFMNCVDLPFQRVVIVTCFAFRIEPTTEWTTQAAYEGFICRVMLDCTSASKFTLTLPTYANGSFSISS